MRLLDIDHNLLKIIMDKLWENIPSKWFPSHEDYTSDYYLSEDNNISWRELWSLWKMDSLGSRNWIEQISVCMGKIALSSSVFSQLVSDGYIRARISSSYPDVPDHCQRKVVYFPVPIGEDRMKITEYLCYLRLRPEGRTLVHYMARLGHEDALRNLLERIPCLNTDMGTLVENWTPLVNAWYHCKKSTAELLIKHNSSLDVSIIRVNHPEIMWIYDNFYQVAGVEDERPSEKWVESIEKVEKISKTEIDLSFIDNHFTPVHYIGMDILMGYLNVEHYVHYGRFDIK